MYYASEKEKKRPRSKIRLSDKSVAVLTAKPVIPKFREANPKGTRNGNKNFCRIAVWNKRVSETSGEGWNSKLWYLRIPQYPREEPTVGPAKDLNRVLTETSKNFSDGTGDGYYRGREAHSGRTRDQAAAERHVVTPDWPERYFAAFPIRAVRSYLYYRICTYNALRHTLYSRISNAPCFTRVE